MDSFYSSLLSTMAHVITIRYSTIRMAPPTLVTERGLSLDSLMRFNIGCDWIIDYSNWRDGNTVTYRTIT